MGQSPCCEMPAKEHGKQVVIGVEEGDVGGVNHRQRPVPGGNDTLVFPSQYIHSPRKGGEDLLAIVGGSIINDDDPLGLVRLV